MNAPIRPQIFLCHASEDKSEVQRVYQELLDRGYRPWLDKQSLLPGEDWKAEIPKAIRAADFVLVFLSAASTAKRGYVQREFKIALDVLEEVPEGRVYVIPVKLDNCEIPARFSNLHWAELYDPAGLERVLGAIDRQWEKLRSTQSALAAAAVPLEDLVSSTEKAIGKLEEVLLAISSQTIERYRNYYHGQRSGLVRLLAEGRYAKSVSIRNGGAWYSFSRASHEQHNEADLCLREKPDGDLELITGFKGLDYGFLLDLGDYPFDELTRQAGDAFELPQFALAWQFLWSHVPPRSVGLVRLEGFKARAGIPLGGITVSEAVRVRSSNTYVLRSITHRSADVLVALRTERVEENGTLELVWKVLKEFGVPTAIGPEPYPFLPTIADLLAEQLGTCQSKTDSLASLSAAQHTSLHDLVIRQAFGPPRDARTADDLLLLQAAGLLVVWPPVRTAEQILGAARLSVLGTTAGHSLVTKANDPAA